MPDERILRPCADGVNRRRIASPYTGVWRMAPSTWADPNEYYMDNDHFHTYVAGDWTVTETQAGATEALTDGIGGQLLVTNTNADNDTVNMQKVGEIYQLTGSNQLWYEARFQANEATQIDLIFGIAETGTALVASPVDDGVWFIKDDGDANIDFEIRKSGTSTKVDTGIDLVADTWVRVGFYFDGSRCHYFVNGVELGALGGTNLPDDVTLRSSMAIQDGDTAGTIGAMTLTVDYVKILQEI